MRRKLTLFWILHYAAKVALLLAVVGTAYGVTMYVREHWWASAEDWVHTLRRADLERLEIQGTNSGPVVAVPSGDVVTIRDESGTKLAFRIAGVTAPPRVGQLHSPAWKVFEQSRQFLSGIALSNQVQVAYTFIIPRGGGIGGVYLSGTNLAAPILEAGMGIIHDTSLKSLPVQDQVRLLAIEKKSREEKRGFWTDPTVFGAPPKAR